VWLYKQRTINSRYIPDEAKLLVAWYTQTRYNIMPYSLYLGLEGKDGHNLKNDQVFCHDQKSGSQFSCQEGWYISEWLWHCNNKLIIQQNFLKWRENIVFLRALSLILHPHKISEVIFVWSFQGGYRVCVYDNRDPIFQRKGLIYFEGVAYNAIGNKNFYADMAYRFFLCRKLSHNQVQAYVRSVTMEQVGFINCKGPIKQKQN
jgi:hypothetical protein